MSEDHTIIHGDCLSEMRKMASETVDLVITDPPFNIGYKYDSYEDNLSKEDYIKWCESWLTECIRLMKDGASLYLINYPENNAYILPFLEKNLTFKRWITWHYPTNIGQSKTNYTRSQHSILFCVKGDSPKTFNSKDIAVPYCNPNDKRIKKLVESGSMGKTPYDVFVVNRVKNVSKEKTAHPCQIPIDLISVFVKASSNPNDVVLDPFGGSFSTAKTCSLLGRKSISIEMDKKYYEIGREYFDNALPLFNEHSNKALDELSRLDQELGLL